MEPTVPANYPPQGVVEYNGRLDRFDQAVGTGWMILAFDAPKDGLLSDKQTRIFDNLGGCVLSVGSKDAACDVIAKDRTYDDWIGQTQVRYATLRPDFYVAATARTGKELAACFDQILA